MKVGRFLIDQWLWNVTWDWYHIPLSIVIMILLFRFMLRIDIIASVLLVISSMATAFMVYTLLVVGVLNGIFNITYDLTMHNSMLVADPLHACLYVALIYASLQSLFFVILNKYYPILYVQMIIISFVAHIASACLIYQSLPTI